MVSWVKGRSVREDENKEESDKQCSPEERRAAAEKEGGLDVENL